MTSDGAVSLSLASAGRLRARTSALQTRPRTGGSPPPPVAESPGHERVWVLSAAAQRPVLCPRVLHLSTGWTAGTGLQTLGQLYFPGPACKFRPVLGSVC